MMIGVFDVASIIRRVDGVQVVRIASRSFAPSSFAFSTIRLDP